MMNRDRLYTVQAVSRDDGTKHNVVLGIDGYSDRFIGWLKLVKSGYFTFSYVVRWGAEGDLRLSNIGRLRAARSASSTARTEIYLRLMSGGYRDIKYPSLEAFERFLCLGIGRPEGFGVCVTVKV